MQDMSDLRKSIAERLGSAAKSERPGAKAKFGTNKRIIRARGHEFLAEDEGRYTRISIRIDGEWEHATTVNSDNRTASEWIEANAQPGNPSRWLPNAYSRPGAKAKMGREYSGNFKRLNNGTVVAAWDNGDAAQFANATQAQSFSDKHGLGGVYQSPSSRTFFVLVAKTTASRPGAKAKMAKRYDAKIVGNELVRSDGRRYQITGRKPSLPKARELQGELEWVMMVGSNGAEYNVQRFEDGGYRVFGGSMGMSVQWEGLLRASRPGAKAKFGNADALLSLADGYVSDGNDEAGLLLTDLVKMRNRGLLSADQSKHLDKIIRDARSMGVFSRPGAKAKFADDDTRFRKLRLISAYLANEANDITDKQIAEWKSIVQEAMTSSDANIIRLAKRIKDTIGFSRPGAKAKMGMSEVLSFVNRALQNAPAGLLRDVMEESLLRYWNHTQAAKKMEQRGDLANATKHRAEAGRETRIYTELWYKMGKSALDLKAITDALNKMTASRPGAKGSSKAKA